MLYQNPSLLRRQKTIGVFDQGGFPAAVWPNYPGNLPCRDLQVEVAYKAVLAV
jgi:hypothetical protein